MNEFSLINQYFKSLTQKRDDVLFGIGDDAACLHVPADYNLLVSTDTLVSGVHFLPEWDAYNIACRSVRVTISDMAAMAAEPAWITLALTLPEVNEKWLQSFSNGLNDSLNQFNIDLVGGDTTHGPLSITLTIMGVCPKNKAIKRNGAKPGDIILVSGNLGAAALAVYPSNEWIEPNDKAELMSQLMHPNPRIDLVPLLQRHASSAIDISDGLSADLNHICVASGVGACLIEEHIPLHPLLPKYLGDKSVSLALTGGDDYEICFTVAEQQLTPLMLELEQLHLTCYPIGFIEHHQGLRMKTIDGQYTDFQPLGYSHF